MLFKILQKKCSLKISYVIKYQFSYQLTRIAVKTNNISTILQKKCFEKLKKVSYVLICGYKMKN